MTLEPRINDFAVQAEADALALYNGNWRSDDLEELIEEYDLNREYAEKICKIIRRMEKYGANILMEESGTNVLRTGDKFSAETPDGAIQEYEFVGFDLRDVNEGIGVHEIVIKNLHDGTEFGVEPAWFSLPICGRKITKTEEE